MNENTLHNLDDFINSLTEDREKRFIIRDKCLSVYLLSLYEYEEQHPELKTTTKKNAYDFLIERRNRYCLSKIHEVLMGYMRNKK